MQENNCNYESEEIIPCDVKKIINRIIYSEKYVRYKIIVKNIESVTNYSSQIFNVIIKEEDTEEEREINLFIKSSKNSVFSYFYTELFFNKEILELYAELQKSAQIPPDDRFKMVKFYDVSDENTIVLENLCRYGYKALDRFERMTPALAESAVKQLAKFHALSFVVKVSRPDYFKNKLMGLKYWVITEERCWNVWKHQAHNLAKAATEHIVDDDVKDKFEKFVSTKFIQRYEENFSYPDSNYGCLSHGDFRPDNLMAKEMIDGTVQVMIVDLQTVNYNLPVIDLIEIIFSKSDSKFRRNNMSRLKEIYYESLAEFLQYFDIDANDVYPKTEFERQFKERLDYGLVMGLIVNMLSFASQESILAMFEAFKRTDLDTTKQSPLKISLEKPGDEIIQDLVNDFAHWGYL